MNPVQDWRSKEELARAYRAAKSALGEAAASERVKEWRLRLPVPSGSVVRSAREVKADLAAALFTREAEVRAFEKGCQLELSADGEYLKITLLDRPDSAIEDIVRALYGVLAPPTTIAHHVDAALRLGVSEAYRYRADPTEPELVAGVFAVGLADLAQRLRTVARDVRLAGVFCHARPMATKCSDSKWKCEVGDLLVVTRYDDGAKVENRALLLQVKKPPVKFATSGTAVRQVELYEHWPPVKIFNTRRDVHQAPHRGAQFSFWNVCRAVESSCPECRWDERIPGDRLQAALADELAEVIVGGGGRRFLDHRDVTASGDDWSGLVWDLLKQSLNKAWSVARRRQSGGSRTWDDGVFVVTTGDSLRLLEGTELEAPAAALLSAQAARLPEDGPPLNTDLPPDPEASDEGTIPIVIIEVSGPLTQDRD
jgi:hypothetical protein